MIPAVSFDGWKNMATISQTEAAELLNYYAVADHVFVALHFD